MTQRLLQQEAILVALAGSATVVTAGERLARATQWAHAESQQAAGREAWLRPAVLPWQAFLRELWTQIAAIAPAEPQALQLLSSLQAGAAWEDAVRESGGADGLLQPRAAAEAAQESWTLCHSYQLDPARFAGSGSVDAEAFSVWAQAFTARSRREQWLDAARLPEALGARFAQHRERLPKRVVFAGFHEWTPQQQVFLDNLQAAGCETQRLMLDTGRSVDARRLACADGEEELRRAALWAAALLERNPASRIGIVVRDLAGSGASLKRALDDALCPSARLGADTDRPYNLSLGGSLSDASVIHDALLLLSLFTSTAVDFSVVGQVLRSPFLCAAESERSARLRFELSLRAGSVQLPLRRVLVQARERDDIPEFTAALAAAVKWQEAQPRRQLPSAWARDLADVLRVLGWPGERSHDSNEHQAIEAFRGVLGELAGFDFLAAPLGLREAVARLGQLAAQQVFQPASADAPVQVMGALEATDLAFDHLWISGWSDDVWPASPRPDPLIPIRVQREHDMPHASARRELEFAERLTKGLLRAAPDVVVSFPQRDADRELRPSPLISGLPELDSGQLPQRAVLPYTFLLQTQAPLLATLDDHMGPAVTIYKTGGGTGVLKSQAACPFQAFARYRLHAKRVPVPAPGLDPAERGSLLHAVLYRLYGELTDQAAIIAKDSAALEAIVRRSVAAALAEARGKQPDVFTQRFLALEHARLSELVGEWLEQERAHTPFSVAQREFDAEIQIGPLTLHTRVDRLDRLSGGGHAIVDYKTGDAKPGGWLGERPDEPQLPCYAVTAGDEIAALLFAVLRPGEAAYRGYARSSSLSAGVRGFDDPKFRPDDCESWEALLDHWRRVLTQLADDFAAGHAEVAPKDRNSTCRVCDLAALCRIDEIEALGDLPDD